MGCGGSKQAGVVAVADGKTNDAQHKSRRSISSAVKAVRNSLGFNGAQNIVRQQLRKCDAFEEFTEKEFNMLLPFLERVELPRYKIIVNEGDLGDRMYILVEGEAVVTAKDKHDFTLEMKTIGSGDVFGEISLFFDNHVQGTTVSTLTKCVFYSLDKVALEKFRTSESSGAKKLEKRASEREMMSQTLNHIKAFGSLTPKSRYVLLDLCTMHKYKVNRVIVKEGSQGRGSFYMITSGFVDVIVGGKVVRTLGPRQYFGDVAVVGNKPHSATVRVSENGPCVLLEVDKEGFFHVMNGEIGVLAEFNLRYHGVDASLEDIIHHSIGRSYLAKYTAKEFAKENIDFWREVDSLEAIERSTVRKRVLKSVGIDPDMIIEKKVTVLKRRARRIYLRYLADTADAQINVAGTVSQEVKRRIEEEDFSFDMFAEAKQEVFELIQSDSFPRFQESEEFEQLLKSVRAYKLNH